MMQSELPSFLSNLKALAAMQSEMDDIGTLPEPHPAITDPHSNVVSLVSTLISQTNDPIIMVTPAECVDSIEEDMDVEWDEVVVSGDIVFNPSMKSAHALTMEEVNDKMGDVKSILETLGCEVHFDTIQSFIYADESENEFG